MSERRLPATPQRLERARREGQVARSRLAAGAASMVGAGVALGRWLPEWWQQLIALIGRLWGSFPAPPTEAGAALLQHALRLLVQVGGAASLGALLAHLVVTGWHPTAAHLRLKLERIHPVGGWRRLFGAGQWLEPLLSLGLMVGLLGFAWSRREALLEGWHRAIRMGGPSALSVPLAQSFDFLAGLMGALTVLACVEALWARRRHLRSLRMSAEEVKQEHRQSEGDPQHKAHRRAQHRQLAAGGPARGVAQATTVVVNPTHLAVALRYAPDEHEAPYLVAKGRESDAFALREEARRLGIPVVRDVPLARSLIPLDVGEAIPEELYRAAAAVLAMAGTTLSDTALGGAGE